MSVNFSELPIEIYAEHVVPQLDLEEALAYGLTSKIAYAIIHAIRYAPDFDLERKSVTYTFRSQDSGIKCLILSKIKFNKFTVRPAFFNYLNEARNAVITLGIEGKENDIRTLYTYIKGSKTDEKLAFVIFDYTTQQLSGEDLGEAMQNIKTLTPELIRAILMHPNAKQIPGQYLANALTVTIKARQPRLTQKVLALPTINTIPASEISEPLIAAIRAADLELIEKVLALPHANQIFGQNATVLGVAIEVRNQLLIERFFAHEDIHLMPGTYLWIPITAAIEANDKNSFDKLLCHKNVHKILSFQLQDLLKVAIHKEDEESFERLLEHVNIGHIEPDGFPELLYAALRAKDSSYLRKLLNLPNAMQIAAIRLEDVLEKAVAAHEEIPNVIAMVSHPTAIAILGIEVVNSILSKLRKEGSDDDEPLLEQPELILDDSDIEDPNDDFVEQANPQEDSDEKALDPSSSEDDQ